MGLRRIGQGFFAFSVNPPTDLALNRHSPGYRPVLSSVLFPAAKKQKRKT